MASQAWNLQTNLSLTWKKHTEITLIIPFCTSDFSVHFLFALQLLFSNVHGKFWNKQSPANFLSIFPCPSCDTHKGTKSFSANKGRHYWEKQFCQNGGLAYGMSSFVSSFNVSNFLWTKANANCQISVVPPFCRPMRSSNQHHKRLSNVNKSTKISRTWTT